MHYKKLEKIVSLGFECSLKKINELDQKIANNFFKSLKLNQFDQVLIMFIRNVFFFRNESNHKTSKINAKL